MDKLDTNGQIDKLQRAMRLAEGASKSEEVACRLGALLLYAGVIDFLVIQAARLVEQIVLKGQLADGKAPTFVPSDDAHFYGRRISTSSILKGIRKLLPFRAASTDDASDADRINKLAQAMLADGFKFLDYRNPLLHQIGNPSRTFEEVLSLADQAIAAYHAFRESHKAFFEAAGPYRFGPQEMAYFYGPPPGRQPGPTRTA